MAYGPPPQGGPSISFSDYLIQFAKEDEFRKDFMKSIVDTLAKDEKALGRLRLDLEDQTSSRARYQTEAEELKKEIAEYKDALNRNAYVVALIDGDGAIFKEDFFHQPGGGAGEASHALRQHIKDGANDASQALKQHIKDDLRASGEVERLPIFARVFANLPQLAGIMRRSGVIDSVDDMVKFAEFFTNSCAEFDYTSVGRGKENADSKMRRTAIRMLSYYYNDPRCKRIYFAGACHDGGYEHILREYIDRSHVADKRIVLVETTPALPQFHSLGFPVVRFGSVFRSEHLPTESMYPHSRLNHAAEQPSARDKDRLAPLRNMAEEKLTPPISPASANTTLPIRASAVPASVSSVASSPAESPAVASATAAAVEVKTSGNGGTSINYPPSYASAGAKDGFKNLGVHTNKVAKKAKSMQLNKDNHRIDPALQRPAQPALDSYHKKIDSVYPKGFCNNWYLTGSCSRGSTCERVHNVKLTEADLQVHRYKARMSPCFNGPECEDFDCPLSHHCPFSPNCARSGCKFSKHKVFGDQHYDSAVMKVVNTWYEGEPFPE